jgi:hypothetical protein
MDAVVELRLDLMDTDLQLFSASFAQHAEFRTSHGIPGFYLVQYIYVAYPSLLMYFIDL